MFKRLIGLALAATTLTVTAQQPTNRKPMVVVISLDAFGADALQDPRLPAPTLRSMMQHGLYARSMQPINPTVTWPNHTAMITGVDASHHHVLANGQITNQRSTMSPSIRPWVPRAELVNGTTVYDLAHEAGLTTAQVDWVAIFKAKTIDWEFPEEPSISGPVETELAKRGIVARGEIATFHQGSQAWRDRIYTQAAAQIIRDHHPNLMLLHLLALDSIEHAHGYPDSAATNTIAFLDDRVNKIVDAVREAGDLDRTTFLIVSDHGQQSVHHLIHPRAMLHNDIAAPNNTQTLAGVDILPEGGLAYVYIHGDVTPARLDQLRRYFGIKEGIAEILDATEFARIGFPTPKETNQAPDMVLFAKDDYEFSGGDTGPDTSETATVGAHGYSNKLPLMQAIFIASGANVDPIGPIPPMPNVNVAATIAQLLGLAPMQSIQGVPIKLKK